MSRLAAPTLALILLVTACGGGRGTVSPAPDATTTASADVGSMPTSTSAPATTRFRLSSPRDGESTRRYLTLQVRMPPGATDLRFQFRLADDFRWTTIAPGRLTAPAGTTDESAPLRWDVPATLAHDRYPGRDISREGLDPRLLAVRAVITTGDGHALATPEYLARIDSTPPGLVHFAQRANADGLLLAGRPVVVRWSRDAGDNSQVGYSVSVNTTPQVEPPAIPNLPGTATSYRVDVARLGTWYFHLRAVDAAGNWSLTQTIPLYFSDAVVIAPVDLQIVDGSTPLRLSVGADAGLGVCWSFKTPGMPGFRLLPPAHVTLLGASIGRWPAPLSRGVTTLLWHDFGPTPGIDSYPGGVELRAVIVRPGGAGCAGVPIGTPSISYYPAG